MHLIFVFADRVCPFSRAVSQPAFFESYNVTGGICFRNQISFNEISAFSCNSESLSMNR